MSSSLVWLPPKKYDSVKSLWQDQYEWCALPVDNTIPLHQTSFLDISETDAAQAAAATRSRASTLRSRASTGHIKHVQLGTNGDVAHVTAEQSNGLAVDNEEQPETVTGHSPKTTEGRKRAAQDAYLAAARYAATRPTASNFNRLRSFHLPAKFKSEPPPPLPATTESWARQVSNEANPPLQEIIVVEEASGDNVAAEEAEAAYASEPVMTSTAEAPNVRKAQAVQQMTSGDLPPLNSVSRRRRRRDRQSGPGLDRPLQSPVAGVKSGTRKAAGYPPIRDGGSSRGQSYPSASSQCMSLRLDLNLEIEMELKVSLHGDLTLSLMN